MNKCKICNNEFEGEKCPNCGHPILSKEKQKVEAKKANKYAIVSIILTAISFLSVISSFFLNLGNPQTVILISLALSSVSLVLSIMAMIKRERGKAIHITALVLSTIWIVMILILVALVALIVVACGETINSCTPVFDETLTFIKGCGEIG